MPAHRVRPACGGWPARTSGQGLVDTFSHAAQKRVTTHWRYAERLAARFPRVRVEPDVLYIDEGRVLTSARSAAGIDLCLHIVSSDYRAEIANQVAKRLVVPPHREGGQAQYVSASVHTTRHAAWPVCSNGCTPTFTGP
jgi:transcriptional regulator GlxA family with amidase domain